MRIPFWLFCGEDWIGYKGVKVINVMWDMFQRTISSEVRTCLDAMIC